MHNERMLDQSTCVGGMRTLHVIIPFNLPKPISSPSHFVLGTVANKLSRFKRGVLQRNLCQPDLHTIGFVQYDIIKPAAFTACFFKNFLLLLFAQHHPLCLWRKATQCSFFFKHKINFVIHCFLVWTSAEVHSLHCNNPKTTESLFHPLFFLYYSPESLFHPLFFVIIA